MKSRAIVALALVGDAAAFWRMPCRSQTGVGRIDPLADYGIISAHAHTHSGGNGMSFTANYASLKASSCTSCEVTQDRSAYWTPTLHFLHDNGNSVLVRQVGGMLAYYLSYLDNVKAFPEGFSMIAGDSTLRNFSGPFPDTDQSSWPLQPSDQFWLQQRALGFNCLNYGRNPEGSLYRHTMPSKQYMDANCADGLRLELGFPSCWNGQTDSPDHKSHVAYPSLVKQGNCPPGYDQHLPFLFYETIWETNAFVGQSGQFVLSYGDPTGAGYHGDFMMGWTSAQFLQTALDTCKNPSGQIFDCPLFNLQNDTVGAQCTFALPDALKNDNVQGPRNGLPVDIPIQYGPERATSYPVAGRNGVATTSLKPSSAPASFSQGPTLSYLAANPAATSAAQGGIVVNVASKSGAHAYVPSAVSSSTSTTTSSASAYVAVPSSAITSAPAPAAASDAGSAVATSWSTMGYEVLEVIIDQVDVYVTATQTQAAGAKVRRHMHKHAHHAGRQ